MTENYTSEEEVEDLFYLVNLIPVTENIVVDFDEM